MFRPVSNRHLVSASLKKTKTKIKNRNIDSRSLDEFAPLEIEAIAWAISKLMIEWQMVWKNLMNERNWAVHVRLALGLTCFLICCLLCIWRVCYYCWSQFRIIQPLHCLTSSQKFINTIIVWLCSLLWYGKYINHVN